MVGGQSQLLPPHFSVNCFPGADRSQVIFSGPDGLAPHRSHRLAEQRPVGTKAHTSEATGDLNYLFRPPALVLGTPVHLRSRSSQPGEIGWHCYLFRDSGPYSTGHQVLMSRLRREAEDLLTHRFQTPWYPDEDEPGIVEAGGYYLKRFPPKPSTRSRTSYGFRPHESRSPMTSKHETSRWKRTPSATQITHYDGAGNMQHPQSEGGSGGSEYSNEQGQLVGRPSPTRANYKNTSKNCSINRGNSNSNGHNSHNSDSSYTTYSRLDTPASSKSERRQRSFY